jgi:serine/threonine-protein kinase
MAVTTHPTPEILAAFARGDLPPAELATVAEHLTKCSACCASIVKLPGDPRAKVTRADGSAKTPGPYAPQATPAPAPSPIDPIPAALADHPRYKILRELGSGGMGVVYKAEHRIMDRIVAIKVLAPHLTSRAGAAERFLKEVKVAARLTHPNIVTVFDAEEVGGLLFLVMEYVEGINLDRVVAKKGPLPIPMACHFVKQAALGLQHAADKGMVHRDIKPQNLMGTRKGHIKIMDFGLARIVRNDNEDDSLPPGTRLPFGAGKPVADPLTNPNLLMGTPDFLSPEQAKNSHAVDTRSDIYSLGCTLYFLLTGRPPFAHAVSLIDKLLAHTEEAPPAIRSLRPEVPEGLAAVVAKMLAKNPDDRYEKAEDVAAELQPFYRATESEPEVIEAVMIAPAAPKAATVAPPPPDTSPVAEGRTLLEPDRPRKPKKAKKKKKLRAWWEQPWAKVGALAIALLLIGGIIFAATRARKHAENPPTDTPTPELPQPKSNPPQPKASANPWRDGGKLNDKELKVLFVVPSSGVWLKDYEPVRKRLEQGGVKVVTASASSGYAELALVPENQGQPVRIDEKLTEDMDVASYSAVIFCGLTPDEYVEKGNAAKAAMQVLAKMKESDKVIAAINQGEIVLILHGAVTGKRVSLNESVASKLPMDVRADKKINWQSAAVVIDGKIVTAAKPEDAVAFAEALIKVMHGE